MKKIAILLTICIISLNGLKAQQTWVDSIDHFARTVYLPPNQFFWLWQHSPMLHAAEIQYEMMPEAERDTYLQYVQRSMDRNLFWVNASTPNFVAPTNGLAFLYRITGDEQYRTIAEQQFSDYMNIRRVENGGVSHVNSGPELWDDTIYMIGVFFLAMYRATGDEQYIDELIFQYNAHKEKLVDSESSLWVHGWDQDEFFVFDFCSQEGWPDPETGRSEHFWGRGNGWIVVTLSELVNTLDEDHPHWQYAADELAAFVNDLLPLQDETTGHWYQLTANINAEDNFLESSSTAMFGYGILTALKHNLVSGQAYRTAVDCVYGGLRDFSTLEITINGNQYITSKNVCTGTCIGDEQYYYDRAQVNGEAYALAMYVIFGRTYEDMFLDLPTPVWNDRNDLPVTIYPTIWSGDQANELTISATTNTLSYQFIEASGQIIQNGILTSTEARLALPQLAKGMYWIRLTDLSSGQSATRPIMVQ